MSAQLTNALPAEKANQYAVEMADVITRLFPSGYEKLARLRKLKEMAGIDDKEKELGALLLRAHSLVHNFLDDRRAITPVNDELHAKDAGTSQLLEVEQ